MQHISAFFPPELVEWDRERRENGAPPTRTPDVAAMNARLDRAQAEHDNAYRLWLFSKTQQGFTEWLAERESARNPVQAPWRHVGAFYGRGRGNVRVRVQTR